MRFSFTDEQEQFRDIVQRFLKDKSPTTEVRRLMETEEGFDPAVWKQLSDDLGLPAVQIPEVYGGQGFSFVGPTICYAFMQAAGLVNDHLVNCFRYDQVS